MSIKDEFFTLQNGVNIPKLGFGTWQIPDGAPAYESVSYALQAGYRHIDTANAYHNEKSVGKAIRDRKIPREEIFVTSKLPAEVKTYEGAHQKFEETMQLLDIGYLDLYLIHAPWPWSAKYTDCTEGNIAVWKAFEEIYNSGRCRAMGVSNFSIKDLQAIFESSALKPAVNQYKFHIGCTEKELTDFCKSNDILVEAYSPLITGRILDNENIKNIAEKYQKTVAQICLRYILQKDILPLPKSTHESYIKDNIQLDFEISPKDMAYLDTVETL